MPRPHGPEPAGREAREPDTAGLAARRDALRQAASLENAERGTLLDAALAELDGAIEELTLARTEAASKPDVPPEAFRTEWRLLRAVFQEISVPLFLLERDGTVRRANRSAGEVIGSLPAYSTGKPFTVFVDLASRAVVQTHLAAVARDGRRRQMGARLLGAHGAVHAMLAMELVTLPGDASVLLVTASHDGLPQYQQDPGGAGLADAPDAREPAASRAVRAMAQRMDLVTSVARMLLDSSTFSEPLTLQRCARMLASDFASCVIIDVARGRRLRRQLAMGPRDEQYEAVARMARSVDPEPGTLPWQVHDAGRSLLLARVGDTGVLGTCDGVPLLMRLGLTSLLSVPISDGDIPYGVLTVGRRAEDTQFEIANLALAEELGAQLAVAIRVDRLFRRRSEIAGTLQAGLLPRALPEVPGVELAAAYVGATEGFEVGGDFYDVYPIPGGWGIAIGDVCGKGEEAAAVTAAARHAIRVLAHWDADPAEVLMKANEILLADEFGARFVTAKVAHLTWCGKTLRAVIATAGHPGPAVMRADGRADIMGGGGVPLGLFPGAVPAIDTLDLAEGDVLFFYSDGLTEARSPDLAYFEENLIDELLALSGRTAGELVAGLQGQVTSFIKGEMRDDMTALAIRVGKAPRSP